MLGGPMAVVAAARVSLAVARAAADGEAEALEVEVVAN